MPSLSSLIVPVGVEALCVGLHTDPERVRFVGATSDFSDLPSWDAAKGLWSGRPYLGESITSFPRPSLQPGIHLHWALPDALTHGTPDAQGRLIFPPAPNRWLVVRLQAGGATLPATRAWVVESDYLDTDPAKASVSIPFRRGGSDQYFRFLGRAVPLEQWREATTDASSFRAQTGMPLTAVGYGEAAFAAFYPNCRNVFGFHDRLEDLADPAQAATLSYLVTGWYSDPALDPAAPAPLTPSGNALGWSFTDTGADGPRRTLCAGRVQGVGWAPDTEYFPDTAHPVEISLGNTTAECVSALIANRPDLVGDADAEFILDAVQTGLLAQEWHHDQVARIEEAIHTDGFASSPGGTSWQVRPRHAAAEGMSGAMDLAPQLAVQLSAVNALQGAYDRAQWETDSLRHALYLDWYRFMRLLHGSEDRSIDASLPALAQPAARGNFLNALRDFLQTGQDVLQDRDDAKGGLVLPADGGAAVSLADGTAPASIAGRLKEALATLAAALATQSGDALVLQQTPGARFWEANEPVMLLSGTDLEPPRRYGGDGTYTTTGELPCRLASEIMCAVRVGAAGIGQADLLPTLPLDAVPCAGEIAALLAEAVLTDPAQADFIAARLSGSKVEDVRLWQAAVTAGETAKGVLSAPGRAPCQAGVTHWQANPWLPLLLEWEVQFQPVATPPDDSATFPTDAITSRYGFDADRIDLVHRGEAPARSQGLRGVTLLTQSAFTRLKESIGKLLDTAPDPALHGVAGDLSALPVLTQVFNGFNQSLLARKRAIQLEVFDPVSTKEQRLFTALREAIGPCIDSAPLPLDPFHGIRAGFLRVENLTLIDAFGRVRSIDMPNARLARARALLPADPAMTANGFVHLPPRLGQPARLNFRLLGADANGADPQGLPVDAHAGGSPVCGWVLVNNLDPGLAIYGADGTALGTLRLVGAGAEAIWQPAPEAGAPIVEPGDREGMRRVAKARIGNAHLADFVAAVLDHPDHGRFLEMLLHTVDRALETIVPDRTNPDPSLGLLVGRPLALVRASLSLELKGLPAFSTSWASLAQEMESAQDGSAPVRNSRGFTDVRFEVKLGDLGQIDDGLVGYFIDRNGDGRDYLRFFSPAAEGTGSIAAPAADPVILTAAPAAPPVCVTLLMDPHGAVHATTGILPVKAVDIPPDFYSAALSKLRVSFPCAPLLAGAGDLRVPVPPIPGFAWSWLQAGKEGWVAGGNITGAGERPPATYSPQRIVEGWLQLDLAPRAKT